MKLIDFTNNKSSKIILLVIIAVLAVFLIEYRKNQGSPIQTQLTRLPEFDAIDVNGQAVSSNDLRGKLVYIQFIDPRFDEGIKLFQTVYDKWRKKNLNLILFTEYSDLLIKKLGEKHTYLIIINENYEEMKKNFHSTVNNFHYLFNKGELIYVGINSIGYEKGIKVHLIEQIDKEIFNPSSFLGNKNVHLMSDFKQLSELVHLFNDEYLLIAFLTDFCDSCLSGYILYQLDKIQNYKSSKIGVCAVLYGNKYFDKDIDGLKSQSGYQFPIYISKNTLTQRWRKYILKFNEKTVSDIVFLIDNNGNVLDIFNKKFDNLDMFFKNITNSIKIKEKKNDKKEKRNTHLY